jgi:hypothetical protein
VSQLRRPQLESSPPLKVQIFHYECITLKPTLKYGSETWVLNNREKQRLEAAQIRVTKGKRYKKKMSNSKYRRRYKY